MRVAARNPLHILHRFGIGRHAPAELLDSFRPGIIGGERQRQVVVIPRQHVLQVACTALDVFARIENIAHTQSSPVLLPPLHWKVRLEIKRIAPAPLQARLVCPAPSSAGIIQGSTLGPERSSAYPDHPSTTSPTPGMTACTSPKPQDGACQSPGNREWTFPAPAAGVSAVCLRRVGPAKQTRDHSAKSKQH